jgi:hypothetical protein
MVDVDEFRKLFEPDDPIGKVREVFGVPEPELKPIVLKWKGKSVTVYDFELFKGIIQDWIKRDNITKEEALDEFFDMV